MSLLLICFLPILSSLTSSETVGGSISARNLDAETFILTLTTCLI